MKRIYLDYAATTPVDSRVLKAMIPYFKGDFGNTMSLHYFGQRAKVAVEESRAKIAHFIGAKSDEVIFTSSATESNNLALKGVAFANKSKGNHIIISAIEHPCVVESAKWLEKQGFEITKLKVDKEGIVDLEELERLIKKETILVSIIFASHEIGTIEPVAEIGEICRKRGVYFHTDAVQAYGKIPIDVEEIKIDLLTASSHKIYGPKGIALLYIRKGVKIEPLLQGGGQEKGLRSSTINVPGVVGFAKATELCAKEMKKERVRLSALRDKIIKEALKIPNSYLNGHPTKRLPNNINLRFDFIEGESLVMRLDMEGIACSTGSACSSIKLEPSHVLLALGLKPEQAHGSLRISLGRQTTEKEVNYLIKILPKIVKELRSISPFAEK